MGLHPDGYISFVSDAFPGAISDNELTMASGFLDTLSPQQDVMADKVRKRNNVRR